MIIKILPFDNFTRTPRRAYYNDAGADVYLPEDVMLGAHTTLKIPLGFGIELPDGTMGLIYSRSSHASKGIVCQMPPIDPGYRGELHAIVSNVSNKIVHLKKGERIGQLVIQPIIYADFTHEQQLKERGEGAFGSTGK